MCFSMWGFGSRFRVQGFELEKPFGKALWKCLLQMPISELEKSFENHRLQD